MSDDDLAKKREGTFFTGIPDFSSDQLTGFGLGVRGNVYWNGKRDNKLFAYTPLFGKIKSKCSLLYIKCQRIIFIT